MNSLAYRTGCRAACADLGITKTAWMATGQNSGTPSGAPAPAATPAEAWSAENAANRLRGVPDDVPSDIRKRWESGLPETHRGGNWSKAPTGWQYHPPAAAPVVHNISPELLHGLGAKKPPLNLLGANPVRNVLLGGMALGGGAALARATTAHPDVQVEPSLPMRTMFP